MTINRCGCTQGVVVRTVLLVLLGGVGFLLPMNAYATVDDKLDALEGKADATELKIDTLETKADAIEAKLDALEGKADATSTAIAALETKDDTAETKLDALAANVSALEAKLDAIEVKLDQFLARPVGAPAFSSFMLAAVAGLLTIFGVTQLRRRTRA